MHNLQKEKMFLIKINVKNKVDINQYIFVVCLSVTNVGVAISKLRVVCKIITCFYRNGYICSMPGHV